MDVNLTQTAIGIASGVVFGNLLPFPKHVWEKVTMGGGLALVSCIGWVIYQAMV